ncbi:protein-disulfide isomerase [Psychrobacillus vulpis]|uniref:Protein-disulfide isomerase n=1 Tax=Psychrobacillus vulpis TaxID=2325572 RepID=A0A544TWD2_9BACI|nr:protein-disulfide isomerase [Psychrobacillus vulpis]TQR21744.1 protein-disulfide isomerase [Psychrobacillus vulpis]
MKIKKHTALFFLSISLIFFLAACSEEAKESTYIAKASDFEDSGFTSRSSQLIVVVGDELLISANYGHTKEKSSIDNILELENVQSSVRFEKLYKNVKIKTKGDKYYLTADNDISLEFQKIGERIIVDEEGMEYYTQEYSKE